MTIKGQASGQGQCHAQYDHASWSRGQRLIVKSTVTFAPQLCGLFYSVQSMHYSCKSYLSSLHFAACPEEDVHKGTDAMIYDMMMMIRACGYACGYVAISHALKVRPLCPGVTMYM